MTAVLIDVATVKSSFLITVAFSSSSNCPESRVKRAIIKIAKEILIFLFMVYILCFFLNFSSKVEFNGVRFSSSFFNFGNEKSDPDKASSFSFEYIF